MQSGDSADCSFPVIRMRYLIHHFLEQSSEVAPDKEAVVYGGQRLPYIEIEKKANQVANWLLENGQIKGGRIAILLRNGPEYIFAYYGILKAGAVAVPLNTGLEGKELFEMISDCQAEMLISEDFFSKRIKEMEDDNGFPFQTLVMVGKEKFGKKLTVGFEEILSTAGDNRPDENIIDLDLASIIYTSGSTGRPKGVCLSHRNIVANTRSIVSYLHLISSDRCMVVLPFYYVYGKSLLNIHFFVHGTIIIDNRFTFPNAVLQNMINEKVTGFSGVPSTFSILLNSSSFAKKDFPDLRYITQAGGHMPAEVKQKLIDLLPGKDIYIMYGATEASARLSYLPPQYISEKINSIGKPIPNVEMQVFNEDGVSVGAGEEGELVARGANLMDHYWNNPEGTAQVLRNGWYYTGDIGFRDEDSFFFVTGRKRDMIKIGIYKVSAVEIEEVLHRCPGIFEAAVVSMHDPILGEAACAFVVGGHKNDLSQERVIAFCDEHLADYKVPKRIVFIENLPKNETGKIMKQQLGLMLTG